MVLFNNNMVLFNNECIRVMTADTVVAAFLDPAHLFADDEEDEAAAEATDSNDHF